MMKIDFTENEKKAVISVIEAFRKIFDPVELISNGADVESWKFFEKVLSETDGIQGVNPDGSQIFIDTQPALKKIQDAISKQT